MKRTVLTAAAALLLAVPVGAAIAQGTPTGSGAMQPIPNPPEAPKHHAAVRHHQKPAKHHKATSVKSSKAAKAK
jgi:hypothetical protein